MDVEDHIKHVRPLLGLRTPLYKIPEYWRKRIEPKIERRKDSGCWFWMGSLTSIDAEPYLKDLNLETGKMGETRLKKIVASWFWDLLPHYEILHACGNQNCLNPRHFYITAVAWNQHDREAILRKARTWIKRWGVEKVERSTED